MVGVAQLVEHLVVAQVAVGSSPITHPINFKGLSVKLNPFFMVHPAEECFLKLKCTLFALRKDISHALAQTCS